MSLYIPHEMFDLILELSYKDKDAKIRQHFVLMLVNKDFYTYFNKSSTWKNIFSMYYQLVNRRNKEIPLREMQAFLRIHHNLYRGKIEFTQFRKKEKIGYDTVTKKYLFKSGQTQKAREMGKILTFPSIGISLRYHSLLDTVEGLKKRQSKLLRINKFLKNKKPEKTTRVL